MGTQIFDRGNAMYPDLPFYEMAGGLQTEYGTMLPPGSRVAAYVRSTGPQDLDPATLRERLVPTLSQAFDRVRAGFGDVIVALPGHSEVISNSVYFAGLRAGTKVIGVGRGSNMPTLRMSALGATLSVAVTDVVFAGMRLRLEGVNGVTKGITVTASDFTLQQCDIEVSSGASNKAAIAVSVEAGGDNFLCVGNQFRGAVAGAVTDGIIISAAVNLAKIMGNTMIFAGTTTNGNIRVTAAATGLVIAKNWLENTVASSVACINFSNVAADGICCENYMVVKNNTTITGGTTGITVGGTTNVVGFFNNLVVNSANASGLLTPAVDT